MAQIWHWLGPRRDAIAAVLGISLYTGLVWASAAVVWAAFLGVCPSLKNMSGVEAEQETTPGMPA
ncbi:MAG: hypothetical protein EHM70_10930 [Chloroflexota bacterium]|nr:MAG: hypothetical protein EHM70_10930 [Chloroflexota bacterium]